MRYATNFGIPAGTYQMASVTGTKNFPAAWVALVFPWLIFLKLFAAGTIQTQL